MANETEIVEVKLPLLPKGYRYTGEYRYVDRGEYYLSETSGDLDKWDKGDHSYSPKHIIEKVKWVPQIHETFWRLEVVACFVKTIEVHFTADPGGMLKELVESGNYFRSEELARKAAGLIRLLLKDIDHE